MAKVRTQADRRQHATVTDAHGRKFWTVIEKDTMRSCGPLIPEGWTPPKLFGKTPFVPPEAYVTYDARDPFKMLIDYDRWIADIEREHEGYAQRMSAAAVMQFGSGAADAVKRQSPELLHYVGPKPMPVAPIKAARAGNLYVLGLSDKMPSWAEEYFTAPTVLEEEFPNVEDKYFDDDEEETVAELEETTGEFPDAEDEEFDPATEGLNADLQKLDRVLDLEEEHDPNATGGKYVDPRDAKRKEPPKEKDKPKPRPKARA